MKELLKARANINLCDCAGWTPLHVAAYANRPYVCYLLMSQGADLSIETRDRKAPWDLIDGLKDDSPIFVVFEHFLGSVSSLNNGLRRKRKFPKLTPGEVTNELLEELEQDELLREQQMMLAKKCAETKTRDENNIPMQQRAVRHKALKPPVMTRSSPTEAKVEVM